MENVDVLFVEVKGIVFEDFGKVGCNVGVVKSIRWCEVKVI